MDEIETIKTPNADNAAIVGKSMHVGLEKDIKEAIEYYYNQYCIVTDQHFNEAIKLEYMIPKVKKLIETQKILHMEYPLFEPMFKEYFFKGFVDLIVENQDGTVDVFDYKYSNNDNYYKDSAQLSLYKLFLESLGFKVNRMGLIMIPKTQIRQMKEEDLTQFRKRLRKTLETMEIKLIEVKFNNVLVDEWFKTVHEILEAKEYPKTPGKLCDWCDYQKYCEEGEELDMLPKNERRVIEGVKRKKIWIYGAPFSGKTTFANLFPDPLMLNTDGNIGFVDSAFVSIKDEVIVEGRITKRILAWDVFKDHLLDLEKKQNTFKTLIIDLLEDVYEYCRLWVYDKHKIEHESDNSFKYYDVVRVEFLSVLKRFMNLDYENLILISHEDTSKDLTRKTGDKITKIAPNFNDKSANKIAGMVDIVARIIAEDTGRFMMFKNSEVVFGGGRLKAQTDKIALDYDKLLKVYEEAKPNIEKADVSEKEKTARKSRSEETPVEENPVEEIVTPAAEPEKKTRTRASKKENTTAAVEENSLAAAQVESEIIPKEKTYELKEGQYIIPKEDFQEFKKVNKYRLGKKVKHGWVIIEGDDADGENVLSEDYIFTKFVVLEEFAEIPFKQLPLVEEKITKEEKAAAIEVPETTTPRRRRRTE